MTVTVKFADRVKPPSGVQTAGPQFESIDDATIAAGVEVEIDEGWLLVLDAEDSVLAAYCPGSVLSAVVVPAPDPTELAPLPADKTVALASGDATSTAPGPSSTGDAPTTDGGVAPDSAPPSSESPATSSPAAPAA